MRTLLVVLILVAMALGAVLLLRGMFKQQEGPEREAVPETVRVVTLYFGSSDGSSLVAEPREIEAGGNPSAGLRLVLEALLAGPVGEGAAVFPEGVAVRAVYFTERTAYVDFSRELVEGFTGGSAGEYLLVASLVQTVCANFPEVDAVRVLVEGRDVDSIGGHLNVSGTLRPKDWR